MISPDGTHSARRRLRFFFAVAAVTLIGLAAPGGARSGEDAANAESRISRIDVQGARSMSDVALSRAIGLTAGGTFTEESLRRACSRILRLYGDAGHPWARVNVYVREDEGREGQEVLFSLDEGRRARLSEVMFTGNEVTRIDVIERQAGIEDGEPFSITRLEEGRKKLQSWDLYDEVLEPRVYEDTNPYRVSVVIPVRESKPNRLSGMLGFGSGRTGARKVWGNVNFLMKNIMGSARRFEMKWSQASIDEKSLAVSYREPWVLGSPFAGNLSFSQRVREEVFTQMQFGIGTSAVFADIGRAGVGFSHERTYPYGEGDSAVAPSEKNSVTADLSYAGAPSQEGYPRIESFDLRASYGVRIERGARARETMVQSGFVMPVWGRGSFQARVAGGFESAFRSGGTYPAYLTEPFGGTHTVRGYRDGGIYVLRAVWSQNELRLLRREGGDLHLFFDHALVSFPVDESTLRTSYLSGFGGGLRARTAAGLLELDLAFASGKGLGESRLHVGLREEF